MRARAAVPAPDTISDALVDRLLAALAEVGTRAPRASSRRLDTLLAELAQARPRRDPDALEELVWALWIAHPDEEAAVAMLAACEAIAAGDGDEARPILDRLVAAHPGWAEAWNKRATLAWMEGRPAEALEDVIRVLEIEPRHFGALSGAGQILAGAGRPREARAALAAALRADPHLKGLREAMAELTEVAGRPH